MRAWWGLAVVLALAVHTMVLPIVREMRKAREERRRRPPGWKPQLRPHEDWDEHDDRA